MRVLLVTFGPISRPSGGLTVRARAAAESLERLGHEVTVVSTEEPEGTPPWPCHVMTRSCTPLGSREFSRVVKSLLPTTDVVIVQSAMFLPGLARAGALSRRAGASLVWDTNELETLHYSRLPASAGVLTRRAAWWVLESWGARAADVVVPISEEEGALWARLFPRTLAKLICVPHSHHRETDGLVEPDPDRPAAAVPAVVFIGNAAAKQNAASVKWIVSELAPRIGDKAELLIIGPQTKEVVAEMGESALAGMSGVHVLGWVDDANSMMSKAEIALAPVGAGAGLKTKVLHYLSLGLRVVGTAPAAEGIRDAPGLTVASLEEIPAVILGMLSQPETQEVRAQRRLAQAEWLEARHGVAAIDSAWRDVLARAVGAPQVATTAA
ncbi:MAG: glycosyltransferase [Acidimicrobiales bacterium]